MKRQLWGYGDHSSDINIKLNLIDAMNAVEPTEDGVRWPAVEENRGYVKLENRYAVI